MRAIIDTAVDAITLIDSDLMILEVSPSSEQMYGIPAEERRGHSALEFIHNNDQPIVLAAIRRIFDEGRATTARFPRPPLRRPLGDGRVTRSSA